MLEGITELARIAVKDPTRAVALTGLITSLNAGACMPHLSPKPTETPKPSPTPDITCQAPEIPPGLQITLNPTSRSGLKDYLLNLNGIPTRNAFMVIHQLQPDFWEVIRKMGTISAQFINSNFGEIRTSFNLTSNILHINSTVEWNSGANRIVSRRFDTTNFRTQGCNLYQAGYDDRFGWNLIVWNNITYVQP